MSGTKSKGWATHHPLQPESLRQESAVRLIRNLGCLQLNSPELAERTQHVGPRLFLRVQTYRKQLSGCSNGCSTWLIHM